MPVALFGAIFYVAAFLGFVMLSVARSDREESVFRVLFALHAAAFLASAALTLYGILALGAVCGLCLASFGIVTLLTAGLVPRMKRIWDARAAAPLSGARFCARFGREILPRLVDEYVATGRARLRFRQSAG